MGPLRRRHGADDGTDRMLLTLHRLGGARARAGGITMHRGEDRAQMAFAPPGPTPTRRGYPEPTGDSTRLLVCPYPSVSVFHRSKRESWRGVPRGKLELQS